MALHASASDKAAHDSLPPPGNARTAAGSAYEGSAARPPRWWRIRLFQGMITDIRRRAPFYWSDWKDAWDYRVVPATVYMYFAKYAPFVS